MESVKEFYKDKSIFITGGSGLVGQILIEKLLRCCEVKNIYMLIRDKKGKTWQERIKKMCEDELYDQVRKIQPNFVDKIIGIVGDCEQPDLGISNTDRQLLINNVNIIFHSAATVNFEAKLSDSLKINVQGTRIVINLCRSLKNLHAMVHVSTAYCNTNIKGLIEEKVYPSPSIGGPEALHLMYVIGEERLNAISSELMKDFPNTYCFTKNLAEDLIKKESYGLPVAIFRPAVIVPTIKEPVVGWTNNLYGPIGMSYAVARGVLRVVYANENLQAKFVPADMCINNMLAIAWDVAERRPEIMPIYNFLPHPNNTRSFKELANIGWRSMLQYPSVKSLWYNCFSIVEDPVQFKILHFFYHFLPAIFIDIILMVMGYKFRLKRSYDKFLKLNKAFEYFGFNNFHWSQENITKLLKRLPDQDKEWLDFDMEKVDWPTYVQSGYLGMRHYLIHDRIETLPVARARMKKLKVMHYIVTWGFKSIVFYLIFTLLYGLFWLILHNTHFLALFSTA